MLRVQHLLCSAIVAVVAWLSLPLTINTVDAGEADYGWNGRRRISYQHSKDLFYNQYVGPAPGTAAAEMYVSPLPVPERVGHTYGTYQPFYPNEYLYHHKRSYYNYHPGAGWTRTNATYGTKCCWWRGEVCRQACCYYDLGWLLDNCCP